MAFLPFFPLASGLLTGKYRQGQAAPAGTRLSGGGWGSDRLTDQNLAVVEQLIAFAESRHHTILELAFSWLLAHRPIVSVIAGATSPAQVQTNAKAAEWALTDAELAEIDRIVPYVAH